MDSFIHTEELKIERPSLTRTSGPGGGNGRIIGYFLRGPIPLLWLERAARQPGKSLHVAILIRLQRGISKETPFKVDMKFREQLGVSRYAWARGLRALKAAGLIDYVVQRGKCARIRLIELPPSSVGDKQ